MLRQTGKAPKLDERPIFDIFAAQMQTKVTEIALRIGMFEALREPSNITDLSVKLDIGSRAADALLAVLCACRLVESSGCTFCLTGISREYLLADSPFFKGTLFRLIPNDEFELLHRVHLQDDTPRPMTIQWRAGRMPNVNQQTEHMHAHTFAAASVFATHPIFKKVRDLLDVAGGAGSFSIALVLNNPQLHCTIRDLPIIAPAAQSLINRFGVADFVTFTGGDIFAGEWTGGFDAVLLSNIFHDWDWSLCSSLAAKAFRVLCPGGRIFVSEMLLDEGRDGPIGPALFSAMMLLRTEGSQLTFSQLTALLKMAGFVEVEMLASFGYYTLVTAQKP
jgi:hypothetical protein